MVFYACESLLESYFGYVSSALSILVDILSSFPLMTRPDRIGGQYALPPLFVYFLFSSRIQSAITGSLNVNHLKNRMCNERQDNQLLACFSSNGLTTNLSAYLIQPLFFIENLNQKQYKKSKKANILL